MTPLPGGPGGANTSRAGEGPLRSGSPWTAAPLGGIALLTVGGNLALILLILSRRALRNTSNYFLVSLFLSDLMVGSVVMPPAVLNHLYGRWVLERAFCSVWFAFDVMCTSASILNLCVISLDRYLLIISPLTYKLRMTPGRALLLILATWTLAALVSFLPIEMGWHEAQRHLRPPNATLRAQEDQCRLLVSLPYALVASGLTFFLPSVAILFTYCRILLAARKQAVQVASLTNNVVAAAGGLAQQPTGPGDARKLSSKHSKRALKASLTLGVLLGMFLVAWLPFFVCNMAQAVCNCISEGLFDLLTWLGYCNSTMNPIIYPLFMRDFKRAMARYLPCCRRAWERRPSPLSLSVRNSNSGPRPGASLRSGPAPPGDADSAASATQAHGLGGQRAGPLPDLPDPGHADPELHIHPPNTPVA
uniref:5-hydroxytryptamine receptor 6 n=1 Tax=Varanus komodoensis TaxID=61221 RepID=A0A8D2Q4Z7_VARKO